MTRSAKQHPTTAPARHTSRKASRTRVTAGTASEWRGPLAEIFRRMKKKERAALKNNTEERNSKMELDKIIGICGPRCTECEAYKATRNGRQALEEVAAKWTMWMKVDYKAEDIECDGCRVENGRKSKYCGTCGISMCATGKGYQTCAHCPDCPCNKIVAPPAKDALAKLKDVVASATSKT